MSKPQLIEELQGLRRHVRKLETARAEGERALRESEERLWAIMDNAPLEISLKDLEGRYLLANRTFEQNLNVSSEEVRGKTLDEIIPEEPTGLFAAMEREVIESGAAIRRELATPCADGIRPFLTVKFPIRNSQQNVVGIGTISTDITERKKAEDALRESEARFHDFADAASDWFWEMDENLRFSYLSERFTEVTGVPQEALLGKTREETGIPDVDEDEWQSHLSNLAAHRPFRDFRHPRPHPDGQTVHLSINGKAVFDEAGEFKGYRGTGSDITERKQAEETLRKTDDLFKQTERLARLGHFEWDEIEDRCSYCSEELARLHGISVEDFLRRTCSSEADLHWLHPEDRERFQTVLENALRQREGYEIEYRLLTDDGDILDVREVTERILDDQGSHVRSVGFVQDITERKEAEEALRESEERFRGVFDLGLIGMAVLSPTGHFEQVNKAYSEFLGYGEDELIGEHFNKVIHPEDLDGVTTRLQQLLAGEGEGYHHERRYRHKEGRDMWGHAGLFVLHNPDGSPQNFVVQVLDISDRKRAEEALRKAHDELEQRVAERTAELREANAALRTEVAERKRAEEEVERSRALLAGAVEALNEGFVIFDGDDRMVLCNSKYRQIYGPVADIMVPGAAMEEVARETARHCVGLQAQDEIEAWVWRRMEQHRKPGVPSEQRLKDGRWIRVAEYPLPNGWTVGTRAEITESKQREAALRENEEMLRAILDHSPAQIYLKDREGRYVLVNRETERLFALPGDTVVGKTSQDLFPKENADIHEAHDRAVLKSERAITEEYEILHKDDLRTFLSIKFPIFDEAGDVRSVGAVTTDITERKRAEEALRESERRYRELFEESPVPMLEEEWGPVKALLDQLADQGVKDFPEFFRENPGQLGKAYNAANRFGITQAAVELYRAKSKEELQAAMTQDTAEPDELTGYGDMISAFHAGATKFEYEAEEIACDDAPITTRIKAVMPAKYRDDWSRVLVTIEDITERKQAEEQLRQVQKLKAVGQLTGGVAHDFNNLLAVIMGNAEVLATQLGADNRPTQAVLRAASRGAELIQRLLAFSRNQPLRPQAVDLDSHVSSMSDLLHRTLGETVEVKTAATPVLWRAMADPGQLENALLNLAINARDAMPGGGKLTIETANARFDEGYAASHPDAAPGDYVMIAVSDSGTGIAPELLERVFEPFFTTKDVGEGSGLGLSMVYGFVKQTGGHVTIYSEPGHGTTVKLYLPRAQKSGRPAEREEDSEVPRARGETVLVIEDDPDVRELAVTILENLGYEVLQAGDGKKTLALLKKSSRIDLMLSDVVLPGGMSGPETAEEVRRRHPAVKTLFMSGYAEFAAQQNSSLDAEAELLNKPFRKRDLAEKVRAVLDGGAG